MLQVTPSKRISTGELLSHPWIVKEYEQTVQWQSNFNVCTFGVCTLSVCTLSVRTFGVRTLGVCVCIPLVSEILSVYTFGV